MAARAGLKIIMSLRQAEILKELSRHVVVIVLAGVNQDRGKIRIARKNVHQGRDLHEIGSGACHDNQRYWYIQ